MTSPFRSHLLIFAICLFLGLNAKAQSKFLLYSNATTKAEFKTIIPVNGGFITAGNVINSSGNSDVILSKIDSTGKHTWTKTVGLPNSNEYCGKLTGKGDQLYLSGTMTDTSNGNSDIFILKFTTNGLTSWSKTLKSPYNEEAYDLKLASNGDFLLCGSASNSQSDKTDLLFMRLDTLTNSKWAYTINSNKGNDTAYAITEDPSGNLYLIGHGGPQDSVYPNIQKFDANGTIIWAKELNFSNGQKSFLAKDIAVTKKGDIAITGKKGFGGFSDAAPFFMLLDSDGNTRISRAFTLNSGDCSGSSIVQTKDGGFLIGGTMGNYYPAMLRLDSAGKEIWMQSYSLFGYGSQAIIGNDGDYLLTGNDDKRAILMKINPNGKSCKDYYPGYSGYDITITNTSRSIQKTSVSFSSDSSYLSLKSSNFVTTRSCSNTSIEDSEIEEAGLTIYPNPSTNEVNIEIANELIGSTLTIHNLSGQEVFTYSKTGPQNKLDLGQLPKGVYYIKVRRASKELVRKLILI